MRFGGLPNFPTRMPLHEHVAQLVAGGPIADPYFGVWQGETFRKWLTLNGDPGSRFVGFDSFEGLPEDWEVGRSNGTFNRRQGADDRRSARPFRGGVVSGHALRLFEVL